MLTSHFYLFLSIKKEKEKLKVMFPWRAIKKLFSFALSDIKLMDVKKKMLETVAFFGTYKSLQYINGCPYTGDIFTFEISFTMHKIIE